MVIRGLAVVKDFYRPKPRSNKKRPFIYSLIIFELVRIESKSVWQSKQQILYRQRNIRHAFLRGQKKAKHMGIFFLGYRNRRVDRYKMPLKLGFFLDFYPHHINKEVIFYKK